MPRTDTRAAPPRRAEGARVLRTTTRCQRPARRLARLAVLALASLLVWPWAVPQAEAARAAHGARADARATAAGQARRAAAAASAQPARTRAAPPQIGRKAARSAQRTASVAARRPAAAARPVPAPADGEGGAPASPAVVRALRDAARATGADPALLLALAWKESRFDPAARNPLSSARGLMQFTEATWLEMVRDLGPRHGLARQAALLCTDHRTGTVSASSPRELARILKLRDNPRLSAAMAAERIARERDGLERALGRPAAPADLYAVHLLGPAGARRFLAELRRAPSRPALEAVRRDGVEANRGVFLARGNGRPLSLAEVHAAMAGAVEEQRATRAGLLARPTAPFADRADSRGAPGAGWVEVAEAR